MTASFHNIPFFGKIKYFPSQKSEMSNTSIIHSKTMYSKRKFIFLSFERSRNYHLKCVLFGRIVYILKYWLRSIYLSMIFPLIKQERPIPLGTKVFIDSGYQEFYHFHSQINFPEQATQN